jgi:hypothetical protein
MRSMLDDGDDYPPTLRPGREAVTMGLAAILVVALIAWAIWRIMLWL